VRTMRTKIMWDRIRNDHANPLGLDNTDWARFTLSDAPSAGTNTACGLRAPSSACHAVSPRSTDPRANAGCWPPSRWSRLRQTHCASFGSKRARSGGNCVCTGFLAVAL
jgi:hypothetical protein